MEIKLAEKYGFCYGVQRAIDIVEEHPYSTTYGPLIHNQLENKRLKNEFNVNLVDKLEDLPKNETVVIRTHGIEKEDLNKLKSNKTHIIDTTCPFVSKPQEIIEAMSKEGYSIIVFGDKLHPEIKGVVSYASDKDKVFIASSIEEVKELKNLKKIAIISQTTKKIEDFISIVNYLILSHKEVRVFNTICNATLENQEATDILSKECDIVIIIGGKSSSNTKQLLYISKKNCEDSFLIESEKDIDNAWFDNKKICGITAGASTPNWIITNVKSYIEKLN